MKVDTRNDKYNKWIKMWARNRDGIDGQEAIKSSSTLYLPQLNGQDDKWYQGYLDRAQYTNYSGRTVNIGLGQIFRKQEIANGIEDEILNNVNLSGQSFTYFSKELAQEIMINNRPGVLIDYSNNKDRPYLIKYNTEEIINWREDIINGESVLSLVVLEGFIEVVGDINYFTVDKKKIWKVLRLEDGIYKISNYTKNKNGDFVKIIDDNTNEDGDIIPLKNNQPLDFIPFYFVTSNGISINISKSVMQDFVNVNLGHYRNSADYENMLHWTGSKSPVLKGWDPKIPVPIGTGIVLPIDGDAMFLEASSDSGLKDEMRHKEEQMAAMGTTIISGQGRYVSSAETARISSQGEYATLSDISEGLGQAMTIIMKEFVDWQGGNAKNVLVRYNKDFELSEFDPSKLTVLMGALQSGYISDVTFYYNMQKAELYPPGWTLEDETKRIKEIGVEVIDEIEQGST